MKAAIISLVWASVLGLHAQESAALRLTKTIPLPGVKSRFDHFAVGVKGHRRLVAALGNNTLEVLDTAAPQHLNAGGL